MLLEYRLLMENMTAQTPPQTPPRNFSNVIFTCKIKMITMQCVPAECAKKMHWSERASLKNKGSLLIRSNIRRCWFQLVPVFLTLASVFETRSRTNRPKHTQTCTIGLGWRKLIPIEINGAIYSNAYQDSSKPAYFRAYFCAFLVLNDLHCQNFKFIK